MSQVFQCDFASCCSFIFTKTCRCHISTSNTTNVNTSYKFKDGKYGVYIFGKRVWNEVAAADSKELLQQLPGQSGENHMDSRFPRSHLESWSYCRPKLACPEKKKFVFACLFVIAHVTNLLDAQASIPGRSSYYYLR